MRNLKSNVELFFHSKSSNAERGAAKKEINFLFQTVINAAVTTCLLYTSDAADERSSVDLGGRRIIKKKKNAQISVWRSKTQ